MENTTLNILLIADDAKKRALIEKTLNKSKGLRPSIEHANDFPSGQRLLASNHYDICLLQTGLHSGPGAWLARRAKEQQSKVPIILLAEKFIGRAEIEALQAGAYDCLTESEITPEMLEHVIGRALARKEQAAQQHSQMVLDRFITKMSARFINLGPDEIEHEINAALRGLGEYAGVDRCYLMQFDQVTQTASMTHEWCAKDIQSAMPVYQNRPLSSLAWFMGKLKHDGALEVQQITALPEEAGELKQLLLSRHNKSIALVLMSHRNEPVGVLGFATLRKEKKWGADIMHLLRVAAEILSNALVQKNVQAALRESENRYRTLIESLWEGILYCDTHDIILNVNSRLAELCGYNTWELVGKTSHELLLPPTEYHIFEERTKRRWEGISEQYHVRMQRKDGSRFWAQVSATPVRAPNGNIVGVLAAISDISQRIQAEEELRFQREFLRLVIDTSPNMIFVTDSAGRFTLVNKSFAESYGLTPEEMVGKTDAEVHPDPREVEMFERDNREVLETHQSKIIPERLTLEPRSGKTIWLHTIRKPLFLPDGKTVQVLSVLTDISERKRAEEEAFRLHRQLLQSQKMEAIGQLAAGVAHDLNNALGAVVGHLQLLKLGNLDRAAEENSVDLALAGCERALSLIDQLLGFSRQGKYNVKKIAIRQVVDETVDFLSRVIGKNFQIAYSGDGRELYVNADQGQLQQALTNLIINAKQAMPHGGVITFQFGERQVSDPQRFNSKAKPGNYVVLGVRDTGIGIAPENIDKVFEPFFTTKTDQGGTGLGLSMVYGIMQNHGGWVEVESEVGRGSTFSLCLPQVTEAEVQTKAGPQSEREKKNGMIMVIDDEPILVDLMQKFLEMAGFSSKGFVTGEDALNWYEAHHNDVKLIILDLKMPKMDGEACYERIRKIDPAARIAILSGYIQDASVQRLLSHGVLRFFQKPLKYPELVQWVTEVLGEKPRT